MSRLRRFFQEPALISVTQLSRAALLLTVYVTQGGGTPVESPVLITCLCVPKTNPFQGQTGSITGVGSLEQEPHAQSPEQRRAGRIPIPQCKEGVEGQIRGSREKPLVW